MKKSAYIKIISFLSVICIALTATSIIYGVRANRLKILLSAERERSLCGKNEKTCPLKGQGRGKNRFGQKVGFSENLPGIKRKTH